MRQSVLVHEEHALDGASHADAFELVAHALKARRHRWVLLEQRIFGAECVVGQRVPVQTVLCYGCCAKQYQSPKANCKHSQIDRPVDGHRIGDGALWRCTERCLPVHVGRAVVIGAWPSSRFCGLLLCGGHFCLCLVLCKCTWGIHLV